MEPSLSRSFEFLGSQLSESRPLMDCNVVGLVALDHVIWVIPTRVSKVTFEYDGTCKLPNNFSSDAASF